MEKTDQPEPPAACGSPSQAQRLCLGVTQIREALDKIMLKLPSMEQGSAKPNGVCGPQKFNLSRLNNDSMEISIDKVLSREFCMNNLAELLGAIHSSLLGTVLLMRNMDRESALPGFVIKMIGDDLQKKLDLLLSIQSYCKNLKTKPATK